MGPYNCGVPTDTDLAAAAHQIELLRAAGPIGRFRLALSLSRSVIELSRRALRRRHPGASELEIGRRFVELHYGSDVVRLLPRPRD